MAERPIARTALSKHPQPAAGRPAASGPRSNRAAAKSRLLGICRTRCAQRLVHYHQDGLAEFRIATRDNRYRKPECLHTWDFAARQHAYSPDTCNTRDHMRAEPRRLPLPLVPTTGADCDVGKPESIRASRD